MRGCPIYIFDDSFSALDVTTDARLRQALWRELPQVTKIVVAQRVSTVVDADRIIVLDGGRIVERGRHAALLAQGGAYAQMWMLQQQEEAQDASAGVA